MERPGPTVNVRTLKLREGSYIEYDDVAGEEPLEIRLETDSGTESLIVTMRTPGADFDLVAGWLLAEGVVTSPRDIETIRFCTDLKLKEEERFNIVLVRLRHKTLDLSHLQRTKFASSACGVCGKTALEQVSVRAGVIDDPLVMGREILQGLTSTMSSGQRIFAKTGGVHAAALFDGEGRLIRLGEDVGRHNAVDKVIGASFLAGNLDRAKILVASGRAGYEILQKCAVARIPIVASVSAPSSLALQVAKDLGITLIGFLRDGGMNIYSHEARIAINLTSNG